MAHVSTVPHSSSRIFFAAAIEAVATFFVRANEARKAAKTYDQLNALTDVELRDIGLERGELAQVAMQGMK